MTKRKSRKATRSISQAESLHTHQNPEMIKEEDITGVEIQNPKFTLEEEENPKIQNSISIEEENGSDVQNPMSIDEEKGSQVENPMSIEEDLELQVQNHSSIEEEKHLKVENPISIEEEIELQVQNPISIEEDRDLEEIQNFNLIQGEKPQLFENQEKGQDLEVASEREDDQQHEDEQQQQQQKQEEEEKLQEEEEPEGMNSSPPLSDLPVPDGLTLGLVLDNPSTAPNVSRKVPKRKKPLNSRQRVALEKKLQLLKENMQPIPFVPSKTLDFSKHEELFKRLGLWDFIQLEFDQVIRSDLLAQLIANYNHNLRYSTVNDIRIKVSCADLARALKLPVKIDKNISLETSDFDSEALSEESISCIHEFMSNWILLHEDTWILPDEVLNWSGLIKKGQPQKVDWAKLLWFMVKKEITQSPQVGAYHYASHIQYLIKSQREDFFKEEPRLDDLMDEEGDAVDLKMRSLEDFQGGQELEKEQIELSLGHDKNESEQQYRDEDVMDYNECKEEPEDQAHWFLDRKNSFNEHCLRRCNLTLESQHVMKEEDQGEERYDPQSKCTTLEGLTSTDLLQAVGTANMAYSPSLHLPDHCSGDFFQSRVETQMNPGGPSMLTNSYKRELNHDDVAGHHTFIDHPKRMRNDISSSDFNFCMEQVNTWISKARGMYEEKEQACLNARMSEEIAVSDLQQQRDSLIHNLQKTRFELQKKEVENYKLEHELLVMSNLLEGYRRALKETRRSFSEYRERNSQPEEPLYKDVGGPGGIVLSAKEFEKQSLEREEEEKMQRCMIEQKIKDFQLEWFGRLELYISDVHCMDKRLIEFDEKVELLKEIFAKRKMSET